MSPSFLSAEAPVTVNPGLTFSSFIVEGFILEPPLVSLNVIRTHHTTKLDLQSSPKLNSIRNYTLQALSLGLIFKSEKEEIAVTLFVITTNKIA